MAEDPRQNPEPAAADAPEASAQSTTGKYRGPARAAPYPLSRLAPAFDLVDVAREIQQADGMLEAVAGNQLRTIAEQIRALQAQARAVVQRAQENALLHRARCNLQKRPGAIYHLYRRPEEQDYFSMLSPQDWNGSPPHPYVGSYRLELDMSWTPVEEIDERDALSPMRLLSQAKSDGQDGG